jgi:hypothetical protein
MPTNTLERLSPDTAAAILALSAASGLRPESVCAAVIEQAAAHTHARATPRRPARTHWTLALALVFATGYLAGKTRLRR